MLQGRPLYLRPQKLAVLSCQLIFTFLFKPQFEPSSVPILIISSPSESSYNQRLSLPKVTGMDRYHFTCSSTSLSWFLMWEQNKTKEHAHKQHTRNTLTTCCFTPIRILNIFYLSYSDRNRESIRTGINNSNDTQPYTLHIKIKMRCVVIFAQTDV